MNKAFNAVRNAYFAVDSFFLVGGCVLAYVTLKEMDRLKETEPGVRDWGVFWVLFYVHRYIR